jgi:hypothetical protein
VKPLLKYGAGPTVKNKDENTPLDVARKKVVMRLFLSLRSG